MSLFHYQPLECVKKRRYNNRSEVSESYENHDPSCPSLPKEEEEEESEMLVIEEDITSLLLSRRNTVMLAAAATVISTGKTEDKAVVVRTKMQKEKGEARGIAKKTRSKQLQLTALNNNSEQSKFDTKNLVKNFLN